MTTIILTIVGILLAAAAALMVVWYGGEAFGGGSVEALAATQVSRVSQLSHAVRLYELQEQRDDLPKNDGAFVQRLREGGYLSEDVQDASGKGIVFWYSPTSTGRRHILIGFQDRDVCARVNRKVGVASTPTGTDLADIRGQLGCINLGGDNNVIFFRV